MDFINVTKENIDTEHICCCITEKKGEHCAATKKAWLNDRFDEGLVFRKLNERGKVFIEYLPAKAAWCPITAPNYMHIDCFWVAGQYKGHGYANQLLDYCIEDAKAKGKSGLTMLSSKKKKPFLSDPGYAKHRGFLVADSAFADFELLYLPFTKDAVIPTFNACAKDGTTKENGMVLYYTNQCPHTEQYAIEIEEYAKQHGLPFSVHKIITTAQAQSAPSPTTTYSFFWDGKFVTNEIFNQSRFEKFLDQNEIKYK